MINKKILLLVVITIVISIFTRFHNLHNFYSETDDHLSIAQLLNYDKLDLYDIANDRKSPSYNGPIKSYLRELQLKKSNLIDNSQLYISNICILPWAVKGTIYPLSCSCCFGIALIGMGNSSIGMQWPSRIDMACSCINAQQ